MSTNGGRVLGVTGLGKDIPRGIERTYQAVKKISWREPTIEEISVKRHCAANDKTRLAQGA